MLILPTGKFLYLTNGEKWILVEKRDHFDIHHQPSL